MLHSTRQAGPRRRWMSPCVYHHSIRSQLSNLSYKSKPKFRSVWARNWPRGVHLLLDLLETLRDIPVYILRPQYCRVVGGSIELGSVNPNCQPWYRSWEASDQWAIQSQASSVLGIKNQNQQSGPGAIPWSVRADHCHAGIDFTVPSVLHSVVTPHGDPGVLCNPYLALQCAAGMV
ncbi:hypothetical protein BDW75DRAFT_115785 [Aspergillus navahoensis]